MSPEHGYKVGGEQTLLGIDRTAKWESSECFSTSLRSARARSALGESRSSTNALILTPWVYSVFRVALAVR